MDVFAPMATASVACALVEASAPITTFICAKTINQSHGYTCAFKDSVALSVSEVPTASIPKMNICSSFWLKTPATDSVDTSVMFTNSLSKAISVSVETSNMKMTTLETSSANSRISNSGMSRKGHIYKTGKKRDVGFNGSLSTNEESQRRTKRSH